MGSRTPGIHNHPLECVRVVDATYIYLYYFVQEYILKIVPHSYSTCMDLQYVKDSFAWKFIYKDAYPVSEVSRCVRVSTDSGRPRSLVHQACDQNHTPEHIPINLNTERQQLVNGHIVFQSVAKI